MKQDFGVGLAPWFWWSVGRLVAVVVTGLNKRRFNELGVSIEGGLWLVSSN